MTEQVCPIVCQPDGTVGRQEGHTEADGQDPRSLWPGKCGGRPITANESWDAARTGRYLGPPSVRRRYVPKKVLAITMLPLALKCKSPRR